jgi:DNA-binding SARP family transcriptional activator/tetratricopeptide (TPR) repeat protein
LADAGVLRSQATQGAPGLQLLRTPQLLLPGRSAHPLNRHDAALLVLLAVDGPTTRARAVSLLWPEADEATARNTLRQRLFRLRRACDAELIVPDELLALAPAVEHDLMNLPDALSANADACTGELLGTQDYEDMPAFAEWLAVARGQWRSARRDALSAIAARLEAEDHVAAALVYAERMAREEPLLEQAHRLVMRLHYRRGDRSAALAAYARLHEALERELGDTPSKETRELLAWVEASERLPVASTARRPLAVLRPPRLVGRDVPWRALDIAWTDRRVSLLTGEPGIGKTRLLADFAAAQSATVVPTRPGDARVPYALLARLVRGIVPDPASLPAWVRAELSGIVPEWGDAGERLDSLRLQAAVAAALQGASLDGVAIDDLQFADEATLEMLPGLLVAGNGPRWILALRSQEQPPALQAWLDANEAGSIERIPLGPLDTRDVEQLLASLALPGLDVSRWAARMHAHTGGNPLFILETLLAMLSQGLPAGAGAEAEAGTALHLPLPDKLRPLIERRLAQLSADALKLARVAALAGSDFSVDLAAAVLQRHPLDLLDAWRELEQAQVMRDNAFAHDLILEASRDSVPAPLRQWLHREIASALEARAASAAVAFPVAPASLAQHWREADEPGRAATWFLRAADAARGIGRIAEQCRLLDAAIGCHAANNDPAARFDAMVQRAGAALEGLSPSQAMEAAQALADAAGDARQRGLACKHVAACHMHAARFDLAQPQLQQAIAESDAAGDIDNAQHARYLMALALAQTVGPAQALERMEALLPWAEGVKDDSLRESFMADLAILLDQSDHRRRAARYFERALAHFDRRRERGNAASTRMMYARSLLMLGQLPRACALLETAVREREELSEGAGAQGIEALNLGRVYCELGRYADVLSLLEPLRERLVGQQIEVVRGATALVLARAHAHMGQTARALSLFKDVPADAPFHQRATLLWTRALLEQERPAERRRLLDDAVAEFQATDLPFVRLPIQFDQLACVGDNHAAVAACRALVGECERRELPGPQMLGRMRLLQMLVRHGDVGTARTVLHGLVPDLARHLPVGCYLPEFHWVCHQAARAIDDHALARRCLDDALQWILKTALPQVPEPFHDSFLHRHSLNRLLLAAASRL